MAGGCCVTVGQVITAGETQVSVEHGHISAKEADTAMSSGKWSARLRLCV